MSGSRSLAGGFAGGFAGSVTNVSNLAGGFAGSVSNLFTAERSQASQRPPGRGERSAASGRQRGESPTRQMRR
jgi:gas vesicle protein